MIHELQASETEAARALEIQLFNLHGPLLSGEALWKTLGYRSAVAFRQAKVRKTLGVRTFKLPNRRANYALTRDVARWLQGLSAEAPM